MCKKGTLLTHNWMDVKSNICVNLCGNTLVLVTGVIGGSAAATPEQKKQTKP